MEAKKQIPKLLQSSINIIPLSNERTRITYGLNYNDTLEDARCQASFSHNLSTRLNEKIADALKAFEDIKNGQIYIEIDKNRKNDLDIQRMNILETVALKGKGIVVPKYL